MSVGKELFSNFKSNWGGYVLAIILGIIVDLIITITPLIPSLIIDKVIYPALGASSVDTNNFFGIFLQGIDGDNYWSMFAVLSIIFLTLIFLKYVTNYIRWQISQYTGTKVENRLRGRAFAKVLSQDYTVISKYTSGELMGICGDDIVTIIEFYTIYVPFFFGVLVFWALSSYFLSNINLLLMILPVVGGIISMVVMSFYSKASSNRHKTIRDTRNTLNTTIQENIQGVRVVRAYATEKIEIDKVDINNEASVRAHMELAKTKAKYNAIFSTISQIIFFGSVIISIYLALNGQMSVGQFATFFAYVTLISNPFTLLADVISALQSCVVSGSRLFTFLDTPNIIVDGQNVDKIRKKPSISMKNCTVTVENKIIIDDISIELPYGKKLGIMGKTGSGKTSLIKTIGRFFEVDSGGVYINGTNIKDLIVEDVRDQFSYVMQDVFLFSDKISQNIAFYNPQADMQVIEKTANIASASDFINELVDGYDTIIGEKGVGLSGGQKQRISIARALLKDAPVLLLDDCTSAVDLETEYKILQGIYSNYPDKSIVIASHRASSIKECDEIVYMDCGTIIERGTHEELMNMRGKYYKVYTDQKAAQINAQEDFI